MPLPALGALAVAAVVGAVRVLSPIVLKATMRYAKRNIPRIGKWLALQVKRVAIWGKNKKALVKAIGQKAFARLGTAVTSAKAAFRRLVATFKGLQKKATEIKALIKQKLTDTKVVRAILKRVEAFKVQHAVAYAILAFLAARIRNILNIYKWINRIEEVIDVVRDVVQQIRDWLKGEDDTKKLEKELKRDQKRFLDDQRVLLAGARTLSAVA
ncbi:MAG: hypothetical protein AAGF60_00205 [Pseudomonadota bacterium]